MGFVNGIAEGFLLLGFFACFALFVISIIGYLRNL